MHQRQNPRHRFCSRQCCDEVWLPSLASVIRERLFKMVRIRSGVCKDVANQYDSAVDRLLVDKLTVPVLKLTNHGSGHGAVLAVGKIESPLIRLGVVQTETQFFQMTRWAVELELHQIGTAIPHLSDDDGGLHFDPVSGAGQRVQAARYV